MPTIQRFTNTASQQFSTNVNKFDIEWSREVNLVLNPTKTKVMLLSTSQLSKVHNIDDVTLDISVNNITLERVTSNKLLGSHIHQHMNWEENVKHTAASCYATITTLKKLKNILPFHTKKK